MTQNDLSAVSHASLAGLALIGIVVLAILGKGDPTLDGLLGAVIGAGSYGTALHTLTLPEETQK